MADLPNMRDSDTKEPPKNSTAIFMLMTLADTTWRMFIPTVGFLITGLYIDRTFNTTPLWMIIGVVVGTIIAIWLIKLQIQRKVN